MGYPSDRLHEEVAAIACRFGWPRGEILGLDHIERRRWVAEVARIEARAAGG